MIGTTVAVALACLVVGCALGILFGPGASKMQEEVAKAFLKGHERGHIDGYQEGLRLFSGVMPDPFVILKGTGKIDGDGWKDTTRTGEVVFVWNRQLPGPYTPGQYPRLGNEHWSASIEQYDFVPAMRDDLDAIVDYWKEAARP